MSTQKYTVEKATIEKIKKLFSVRKLTAILKASGMDKDKDFVANIINVQYQIYMLDGYLESQWDLDKKNIKSLWDAIRLSLKEMGFSPKEILHLVKDIKEYERMERNMRKDKWPTKESIREFYTIKACDVRLIRQLIYHSQPEISTSWKEKSWKYYDIISEINDDISDVKEDLHTFNGNRYLISILRKGQDKTYHQYSKFIASVAEKAKEHFEANADKGQNKQLASWTTAMVLQTMKLLDAQRTTTNPEKLSASLLLTHMR